jgi:multidrug efflux pump subunit AcrA (membrane-fusion protein)
MTKRTSASWLVYALGALSAGAIAAAILVVGPASGSQASAARTVTVAQGVVQSTVSGSGNIQPASELDLGFKTSGTVTSINMTQGEQVAQGQLLATLDPQSAEVTLEQAKATLQSAEANLAKEEETDGETSSGQSSSGSGAGSASTASTASVRHASAEQIAIDATGPAAAATAGETQAAQARNTTAPATTSPGTPPATTTPTSTPSEPKTTDTEKAKEKAEEKAKEKAKAKERAEERAKEKAKEKSKEQEREKGKEKEPVSTATREANLASARAAVKSDTLTVQSDEQAVQNAKLDAPEDGTIVSLSGQVGETVSGGGTTRASTTSSSSSGSGSGAAGTGSTAGSGGASSSSARSSSASSSSTSGSTSSPFAVLSDLSSMQLVVPLSESEVGNVKNGQTATVTVEALESRKLAAHVSEIATLSTSNSGVVSYDVTFQLDQMEAGLKPGMSATAEVVVKQAEGVNVPTTAISGGAVTVIRSGKQLRRPVVTGLAGNSSTIILSGLKAGEEIALPVTSSTGTSSLTSKLGSRTGSGALGSGGLGSGGFAGGGAFRGGGGAAGG